MKNNSIIIRVKYDISSIVLLSIPTVFVFAFSIAVNNWNSWFFSIFLSLFLFFLIKKGDVFDAIFYICITSFVVIPLLSVLIWSSFNTFLDGGFREVFVEERTVDNSLYYILFCIVGWWIGSLIRFNIKAISINNRGSSLLVKKSIVWFSVSLLCMIFFSVIFDYNIAGKSTTLNNSGVYYYAFPIDYLACLISFAIGFKDESFLKYKKTLFILILGYVIYKLACGWKSPLLNVLLSFLFGFISVKKYREIYKLIIPFLILLAVYVFFLNPIADYFRGGSDLSGIYDLNPFSNRLTEGTFFGISLIDNGLVKSVFSFNYLLIDFLERIVPGNNFNQKSLDFYIAQELLGQQDSVQSTFAPGILGMLAILDSMFFCVLYGFSFRVLINFFILFANKSRNILLKYFVMGTLPAFVIYLCSDGYYGGAEKLIIFSAIIYIFSNFLSQRKI